MLSNVDGVTGDCDQIKLLSATGDEKELPVEAVRIRRAPELDGCPWLVEAEIKVKSNPLPDEAALLTEAEQLWCRMRSDSIDNLYTVIGLNYRGWNDQTVTFGANTLCLEMMNR